MAGNMRRLVTTATKTRRAYFLTYPPVHLPLECQPVEFFQMFEEALD